jgi:hypothetical protein
VTGKDIFQFFFITFLCITIPLLLKFKTAPCLQFHANAAVFLTKWSLLGIKYSFMLGSEKLMYKFISI